MPPSPGPARAGRISSDPSSSGRSSPTESQGTEEVLASRSRPLSSAEAESDSGAQQSLAASYERQIASARARGDRSAEDRIRLEYETFLESWRAQVELEHGFSLEGDGEPIPLEDEQERKRAAELLGIAERFPSRTVWDRLLRARVHSLLGHHGEALRLYDARVALVPRDPQLHHARGRCLSLLEHWGPAQRAFGRALELDPGHSQALRDRGIAFLNNDRAAEGLVLLRRSFAPGAGNAETHFHIGEALCRLGRPEEAIVSFERALRWSPGELPYIAGHARALLSLGRTEEAAQALELALGHELFGIRRRVKRILHRRSRSGLPREDEDEGSEDERRPSSPLERTSWCSNRSNRGRRRSRRRSHWLLLLAIVTASVPSYFAGSISARSALPAAAEEAGSGLNAPPEEPEEEERLHSPRRSRSDP